MTRVLLAFDKFKDALTAQQAGEVVAAALREQQPGWVLDLAPLVWRVCGFALPAMPGRGLLPAVNNEHPHRLFSIAWSPPEGHRPPRPQRLVEIAPPIAKRPGEPLPASREKQAARAHDRMGARMADPWHVYPEHAAAGLWTELGSRVTRLRFDPVTP